MNLNSHFEYFPLFSIITPSFNQFQFLEETILSVLNQDYPNIEYIVIDGGSTDNSVEILKKYSSRLAYWVSEKDKGQADAINKGLLRAKGELVMWINSDDILYPEFISLRVKQFKNNPSIDLIYGDVDQGEKPGNTWLRKGSQTDSGLMKRTLKVPIPQQSVVFRRSVIELTGLLNTDYHYILDRDWFIRITQNHKILYIPGSNSFFRTHSSSKSVGSATKWVEELVPYYSSLCEKCGDYISEKNKVMALCYWECSKIFNENKFREGSRSYIKKAFSQAPFMILKLKVISTLVSIKHFIEGKA